MSTSSSASLGSLRIQAQQRSDMENNPAVSVTEWNQYISQSYKELYDLLVAAYGNDYFSATTYQFTTNGSALYPLPDGSPTFLNSAGTTAVKFYKLLGVDLFVSGSPSGWISLLNFEFIERNKGTFPNVAATSYAGYTNLKYRLNGSNLQLKPLQSSGQLVQLWYVPAPTSLTFLLPCGLTVGSTTITLLDTTGLSVGMKVYGSGIVAGTTISSLTATTVVLLNASQTTDPTGMLYFWSDGALVEGVSGWEEFIVIDAAIKAQIKQENDFSGLAGQKQGIVQRIEAMSEGRDAGQAQHVSDVLSINSSGQGYGDLW